MISELVVVGHHVLAIARNPASLPAGVNEVLREDLATATTEVLLKCIISNQFN